MRKQVLITLLLFLFIFLVIFFLVLVSGCPYQQYEDPTGEIEFAASEEFIEDNILLNLQEEYDFMFGRVHEIAIGLTHEALKAEDVDVAVGFATDGKIKELELVKIEDDKNVFQANHPSPVIREEALEQHQEIPAIMEEITPLLDTTTMKELNYKVDIEEMTPEEVAHEWLIENNLIDRLSDEREPLIETETNQEVAGDNRETNDKLVISSREFTEQRILGKITVLALKEAGIPVEDRTEVIRTEPIRSAIMRGQVDMYWDYAGSVWRDIYLQEEVITDAEEIHRRVAQKEADEGLIWLDYAPLNNTYTVLMRKQDARKEGIETLSDLAEWVKERQKEKERD